MHTARQINLVQDSFAATVPITDCTAAEFYRRLFELVPDTKALFRIGDDIAEQGRKLFLTLATVVDALDRLDTIVPVARELGQAYLLWSQGTPLCGGRVIADRDLACRARTGF